MSKKHTRNARAPTQQRTTSGLAWLCSPDTYGLLTGYTPLSENPEIQTAIQRIADLVSSMTIHLMENARDGDKRLKNELSRKVDITPCKYITRKAWIETIVKDMILGGNSVQIPHYRENLLDDIEPLARSKYSILDRDYGYDLLIRGERFEHDEVLHFILNPDPEHPWRGLGYAVLLKNVAKQLARARTTAAALMESPAPSIIVKVDGLTEEFASPDGRRKLSEQYLSKFRERTAVVHTGGGVRNREGRAAEPQRPRDHRQHQFRQTHGGSHHRGAAFSSGRRQV